MSEANETSSILVRIGFEKPVKHLVTIGPVSLDIDRAKKLYKATKNIKSVPCSVADEFSSSLADFILGKASEWKGHETLSEGLSPTSDKECKS